MRSRKEIRKEIDNCFNKLSNLFLEEFESNKMLSENKVIFDWEQKNNYAKLRVEIKTKTERHDANVVSGEEVKNET